MIPKIVFKYSSIHDSFWQKYLDFFYKAHKNPKTKKILDNYPSRRKLENYIEKVRPLWEKEEQRVLKEIERIMNLKWQEPIIKVYLVGGCIPYSDPLTMKPYPNLNDFVDVLIHELIHQIQSQNSKTFRKWLNYMRKKYGKEKRKTKSHILLHAVHKKIYLELFDEKRLKRNLKRSVRDSYKRAWQIVEEEGYEEIIKKFKKVKSKDVNA